MENDMVVKPAQLGQCVAPMMSRACIAKTSGKSASDLRRETRNKDYYLSGQSKNPRHVYLTWGFPVFH
jgi:hypothetical protein